MADGGGNAREADGELALRIIGQHQRMYDVRGNFNTLWQTVSEHVLPNYSDFTATWAEGQRRTNRVFDDTAPIALGHGCAALESMLCPASRRWHRLIPRDKRLRGNIAVMQYLEEVVECLFAARYAPAANFQSQIEEVFKQILAFGNGPMLVDDVVGYGLRYRCLHLAYTYGIENAAGVIDTIHSEFKMSAKACVDAEARGIFDKGSVPAEISESVIKQAGKPYSFIRCIEPDEETMGRDGIKRFRCTIVCRDLKIIMHRGWYNTQPILFARYSVNPTETYGRGPCVDVLPTILQLNEMEKTDVRQTQRAGDPPLITVDDQNLPAFNLRGNSINYGYVNPQTGKPLIMPLASTGDFQVLKEKLDEKRKVVQAACLNDIFSILTEQPNMTATEVLQRAQEKGYLLAPIVGRIQSELISPMITRELDILQRAGQLPPPPQVLRQLGNLEYEIVYSSQVQAMQKQSKALAIGLVFQQAAPLIQADPTVLKNVNMTRTFRELVEANDAPASMLNTDEEQAAKDQAEVQQQQLTNIANIAGPASSAIKNLAQANQAAGSATPGQGLQ